MKTMPYEEFLKKYLADPANVEAYLNTSLEEDDPRAFLLAIKTVVKLYGGGMSKVCKRANVGRASMYKSLSGERNPRIGNIQTLLDAMGFALEIKTKNKKPVNKKKRKTASVSAG
ncbi:MAG: DNA-binding protein [Nitrospinales bacterium]